MNPKILMRREFKKKYLLFSIEAQLEAFQVLQKSYTQNPEIEILREESTFLISNILGKLKLSRGTKSFDTVIDFVTNIDSNSCEKLIRQQFLNKLINLKIHKIAGKVNPFHINGGVNGLCQCPGRSGLSAN